MRILILYRHFWPDSPPYASMLRMLGADLVAKGHDVTIWTEQPCYKQGDGEMAAPAKDDIGGIQAERLGKLPLWRRSALVRLADKVLFPFRILLKALFGKARGRQFDVVWTATIPPVAMGLTGRAVARLFGARFVYHCQDLYPEIAVAMDIWPREGLIHRIARSVERRTRERADLLVTLSDDMANTVRALAHPRKLAVINNFALDQNDAPPAPNGAPADRIRLIFAGNLGLFQGLEAVIDAMKLLEARVPQLDLVMLGEGKALASLKERATGLANVSFEPHRPFEEAKPLIAAADLGLVSLEPDIYRYAFPSKTLTYLKLGVPLLAVVEPESELAAMITREALGWSAADRSPAAIADALETACRDLQADAGRSKSDLAIWASEHTGFDHIAARWHEELSALKV